MNFMSALVISVTAVTIFITAVVDFITALMDFISAVMNFTSAVSPRMRRVMIFITALMAVMSCLMNFMSSLTEFMSLQASKATQRTRSTSRFSELQSTRSFAVAGHSRFHSLLAQKLKSLGIRVQIRVQNEAWHPHCYA